MTAVEFNLKLAEVFERWQRAIATLDAIDRQRAKAAEEYLAAEAELRALARKGGS